MREQGAMQPFITTIDRVSIISSSMYAVGTKRRIFRLSAGSNVSFLRLTACVAIMVSETIKHERYRFAILHVTENYR